VAPRANMQLSVVHRPSNPMSRFNLMTVWLRVGCIIIVLPSLSPELDAAHFNFNVCPGLPSKRKTPSEAISVRCSKQRQPTGISAPSERVRAPKKQHPLPGVLSIDHQYPLSVARKDTLGRSNGCCSFKERKMASSLWVFLFEGRLGQTLRS
jgi:hypothetical protein